MGACNVRSVEQVLAGDVDAFGYVVEAYGPAVRAYLAGHLTDPHTVEDIAQETFIAAYENLRGFKPEMDMGNWLRGIARNKLNMHLRSSYTRATVLERRRLDILQSIMPGMFERSQGDGAEAIGRLRECVTKLPDRLREAVHARYVENEKVMDMARRLGKSAMAISALLFRARRELELCMGRSEPQ